MISHVHIGVAEFERALRFYEAVMRSVGAKQRFVERERPWAGCNPAMLSGRFCSSDGRSTAGPLRSATAR